jgi:hypothetical protein
VKTASAHVSRVRMSVGFPVAPAVGRAALKSSARMGKTQALRRFPGPWCCSLTPEGAQEKPAGARRARAPDPDPDPGGRRGGGGGAGARGKGGCEAGGGAARRALPCTLSSARIVPGAPPDAHHRTPPPQPPPRPPLKHKRRSTHTGLHAVRNSQCMKQFRSTKRHSIRPLVTS